MSSVSASPTSLGQHVHEALPVPSPGGHEEIRQGFAVALRRFTGDTLAPLVKEDYEQRRASTSGPDDGVAAVMAESPLFKAWSSVRRSTQELLWETVEHGLSEWARPRRGQIAVELEDNDAADVYPDYLREVDIHCMPGGYIGFPGERFEAGARYDRGVYLYTMGQLGPKNDNLAHSVLTYLEEQSPDFKPRRIVDLGCTVGNRTLPYADHYGCEVIGVDVSPSLINYAGWRARALGASGVTFEVADARRTGLTQESADLVVSHIILHEMPPSSVVEVLAETKRLVAPGGMAIHADYGQYADMDDFSRFMISWDTVGNNEPYWSEFRSLDLETLAGDAGMDPEHVEIARVPVARRLQTGDRSSSGSLLTLLIYRAPVATA